MTEIPANPNPRDFEAEVAARFKAKGCHAHYCHAVDGTAHSLEITTYPTNHDI